MDNFRCINCMSVIGKGTVFCPMCGFNNNSENGFFCLPARAVLKGRYIVGRTLGQGGFGITYMGYDTVLDICVAIKEYYPKMLASRDNRSSLGLNWHTTQNTRDEIEHGRNVFLNEARKMAKVDIIPEIVRIRDVFTENDTAYIVMDYVNGVTLKQHILNNGVMSYLECVALLEPLMNGLDRVHRSGIIHRDISPDNIMITVNGEVRLLDLGAAKDTTVVKNRQHHTELVAKKGFSPLEQYTENGDIGTWTDVYALCATMYYCITGKTAPASIDRTYNDSLSFNMPMKQPLTPNQEAVLRAGLSVNIRDRIKTMVELANALRNPLWEGEPPEEADHLYKLSKTVIISVDACIMLMTILMTVLSFIHAGDYNFGGSYQIAICAFIVLISLPGWWALANDKFIVHAVAYHFILALNVLFMLLLADMSTWQLPNIIAVIASVFSGFASYPAHQDRMRQ